MSEEIQKILIQSITGVIMAAIFAWAFVKWTRADD